MVSSYPSSGAGLPAAGTEKLMFILMNANINEMLANIDILAIFCISSIIDMLANMGDPVYLIK